jgi:hypothetical protein
MDVQTISLNNIDGNNSRSDSILGLNDPKQVRQTYFPSEIFQYLPQWIYQFITAAPATQPVPLNNPLLEYSISNDGTLIQIAQGWLYKIEWYSTWWVGWYGVDVTDSWWTINYQIASNGSRYIYMPEIGTTIQPTYNSLWAWGSGQLAITFIRS